MKKASTLIITLVILLMFTSCSSNSSENKLIENITLGATMNQVIEALGYSEDYYNKFDDLLEYKDIELFGQYCNRASFNFKNNELDFVIISYPIGAEYETILKFLEKSYGKPDDDKITSWHHNGVFIGFTKGNDELGSAITISKD